jgi:hypothetical protein
MGRRYRSARSARGSPPGCSRRRGCRWRCRPCPLRRSRSRRSPAETAARAAAWWGSQKSRWRVSSLRASAPQRQEPSNHRGKRRLLQIRKQDSKLGTAAPGWRCQRRGRLLNMRSIPLPSRSNPARLEDQRGTRHASAESSHTFLAAVWSVSPVHLRDANPNFCVTKSCALSQLSRHRPYKGRSHSHCRRGSARPGCSADTQGRRRRNRRRSRYRPARRCHTRCRRPRSNCH